MKKYSIIHIPLLSFFSEALYRDVGFNWKGTCFGYLILLLAACWIPVTVKIHNGVANFIENEAPSVIEQIPEITISNGEVSIAEPQPYYIKDPDSNDVLAIIDTTGTINSLGDTNAFCLVTKSKLITRNSEFETRTYSLENVEHFTLDNNRIMDWARTAKNLIAIIIYPFALLTSYVGRIIQALIYAAIGLLFASWCKAKLPYTTLLRLSVVAVTPCILVKTFFIIANIHLPYSGLIFLIAALGYLFWGVKATTQPAKPQQLYQPPYDSV